jgi:hypothetical protein
MRLADKSVLGFLALVALTALFWFMVLAPKRDEAAKLSGDITELEAVIAEQEQVVRVGEQARRSFPRDYGKLVVLGKAVPEDADTAALLVQLSQVASHAAPPPPATETETQTDSGATEESGTTGDSEAPNAASSATGANPALATEAAAANLPIGATVGPAGLPVLSYKLRFRGNFFGVADFMRGVDSLIRTRKGGARADGRLLTVDGFSFSPDEKDGFPMLTAWLSVTAYATPTSQGLTVGATSGGPAPVSTQPQASPPSAEVAP